jgi:hypothetical protein
MTKRSIILTVLAILLFVAAIISLLMEKNAIIKENEEPDPEPGEPTITNKPDNEPGNETGGAGLET